MVDSAPFARSCSRRTTSFPGVTVGGRDAHPIGRRDGTAAGEGVRAREGRVDTCQAEVGKPVREDGGD